MDILFVYFCRKYLKRKDIFVELFLFHKIQTSPYTFPRKDRKCAVHIIPKNRQINILITQF